MSDDDLRVAVIGAGGMGRFHATTLQSIPGVVLAAVTDPFADAAHRAASEFGVPVSMDPHETATAGYDGVVIASPDGTHASLALAAMQAGSRVLCEKPLSTAISDARELIAWEMAHGARMLQLGFMREYDPAHVDLREAVRGLGELYLVRCTHRNSNNVARPPDEVVVQSIIHDIHTVHWLTEAEVVVVDARAIPRPGGLDHVLLVLTLDTGASAVIEFSDRGYAYEVEVEVTANGAVASMGQPARPTVRVDGVARRSVGNDWFARFAEAYRFEDTAWVQSLTAPEAVGPSAMDGLRAQLVAEAALASLSTGTSQKVGEAA